MYKDSNGVEKSAEGWAQVAGIKAITMRKRLRELGWTVERAISEPVGAQNGKRNPADPYHWEPQSAKTRAREHVQAVALMMRMIKNQPCADCSERHHTDVMEFDHVPERGEKLFALSDATGRRLATIMAEIAKCDLVCANCHRRRTKGRRQLEALNL